MRKLKGNVNDKSRENEDDKSTDNFKVKTNNEEKVDDKSLGNKGKTKHRKLTNEEDPHLFHANPKDLDTINIAIPENTVSNDQNKLFTHIPFNQMPLDKRLISILEKDKVNNGFGLINTTYIQSVTIPMVNSNNSNNLLIKSQTGSGKTLAYLLPIINSLLSEINSSNYSITRSLGTIALIIAPTRELCNQINEVLNKLLSVCVFIIGGSITGGEKKKSEKARLRKGINILVATPGRLLDHLQSTEAFTLNNLKWFILDEADRLLDMGFENTIIQILNILNGIETTNQTTNNKKANIASKPGNDLTIRLNHEKSLKLKQTKSNLKVSYMLVSATLTNSIISSLVNPIITNMKKFIIIDSDKETIQHINNIHDLENLSKKRNISDIIDYDNDNNDNKINNKIDMKIEIPNQLNQHFMIVSCKWRLTALITFLKINYNKKIIIFFLTCDSVDFYSLLLSNSTWPIILENSIGKNNFSNLNNNNDYLEPLKNSFYGLLGNETPFFRLHGNMSQNVRQSIYKDFSTCKHGILLCTDVAARGLDIQSVDWIISYDPPCETIDYIHRIGRTARKGLSGSSLIFLLPSEINYLTLLSTYSIYPKPLSLSNLFIQLSNYIQESKKFKNIDEISSIILQRKLENTVYSNKYLLLASQQAYRSFLRAYATHSNDTKKIFNISSLHLGHVAKTFGLIESPTNTSINATEDIIGRIMNGEYTKTIMNNEVNKINDNNKILTKEEKRKLRNEKYSLSNKLKLNNKKLLNKNKIQKLRKVGKDIKPSGKFRKSKGGYFKRKLSLQSSSEFSQ